MNDARTNTLASSAARGTTSTGGKSTVVWLSLVLAVVILAALLIFIAQNSQSVEIHYLGANTSIGFGVALLLAAVAGILLTVLVGAVLRIRRSLRSRA